MYSQQSTFGSVERIKSKLLVFNEKNPGLFHEIDVQKVRSDDWQTERFITEHENEDKAYEAMVKALKWKKSFGVYDRTDDYFPKEFYEFMEREVFGIDKEGHLIHWEKNRDNRKISELNLLTKQFMVHIINKLDGEAHRKGVAFIIDTNGSGLSNVNMEIEKFKIEMLGYYPELMKCNLLVDLPWVLSSVAKVIVSLFSPKLRERVKYIKRNDLDDYMDPELIPVELGGQRIPKYIVPEGLSTMKELVYLGLSDKIIEKYYKSFNRSIEF